jgi:hypothetical protein
MVAHHTLGDVQFLGDDGHVALVDILCNRALAVVSR